MYELRELNPDELDAYVVAHHPEANFLQMSKWGKCYEEDGKEVFYFGFYKLGKTEKLIGTALTILRPAKRGRYLEIPGGPLLDWQSKNTDDLVAFMARIKHFAAEKHCVFVRMRPNVYDSEAMQKLAKKLDLVPAPMHLHAEHTVMLDLTKSEEELMADMRRQTRYEVRRADKLGIEVKFDCSKRAFSEFYDLQIETAKRQGFIQSSRDFIMGHRVAFGDDARIYTAYQGDQVLARGLIIMQKPEAIYYEAASTEAGRKLPGAYALTWRVMRDAKAMGIERYNLFGIAPPNSPNHRYAGVTTFKTGFGGEQVAFLHAHDLVVKPLHYKAVQTLEEIRKKRRHL